jgi:transcriptional regulator with XRE-family HTH domain
MGVSHDESLADLGRYIRAQREIAQISLRSLARLTNVSDSYLSQVERGLYQPSGEVLKSIARGLGVSPDSLFHRMGWIDTDASTPAASVPESLAADERLSAAQKAALVQLYKTMVEDL